MAENRIKELRAAKGLTQNDVATKIDGIFACSSTKVQISMIENGYVLPTVPVMRCLCELLDCKPNDLYDDKDLDLCLTRGKESADTIIIRCGYEKKLAIMEAIELNGYEKPADWFKEVVRVLLHEADIVRMMRRIEKSSDVD